MSQISFDTATNNAVSATPSGFGEMSSEEFIEIIFTELTNQDPLEPNDTSALLEQLNSIRSIESDLKLAQTFESLVLENQIASGSNMIGKFIGGLTEDAQRVAGYVVSAIRQGDEVFLELDNGWLIDIENVETILDPAFLDDPPPPIGGGNDDDSDDGDSADDPPPAPDGDGQSQNPPVGSGDDSIPDNDGPASAG